MRRAPTAVLIVVAADDPLDALVAERAGLAFLRQIRPRARGSNPSSQQEAYDGRRDAFDLSERYRIPVLMRLTTPHGPLPRAVVTLGERRAQNERRSPENKRQWVRCPPSSRARYDVLVEDHKRFGGRSRRRAATTATPTVRTARRASSPRGIAHNYLMENYPQRCPTPC